METFPPKGLKQPIEEVSQSAQALTDKRQGGTGVTEYEQSKRMQFREPTQVGSLGMGTNILDELESISQIGSELETI